MRRVIADLYVRAVQLARISCGVCSNADDTLYRLPLVVRVGTRSIALAC